VTVTAGSTRMFSTRLQLSDRQTMEVQVKLRPGLAFLGALGGSWQDAENLEKGLLLGLGESERWALIDRSPEAPSVLERLGVDGVSLRAALRGDGARGIDWPAVQAALDAQVPGLLYVLAVIDPDLLGRKAAIWILGAAPSPPRPDRLELQLGDSAAMLGLRAALDASVPLRRASLGAVVVDSNADANPVVVHVTPAGPAEAAELLPGDAIFGADGLAINSRADLEARILAAESGEAIELGVRRGPETRTARVRLAPSPRVLATAPAPGGDQPLESIAFADLVLKLENADESSRWLLQLNQALVLLRAEDDAGAAQILRRIRAPQTSHGVGQATVDYYLGVALERLGPDHLDEARRALERAAALPDARRHHADGAWLAPRARARLFNLGG
ncbi:MAG: PDZ domain-containing protein, partial [Acidobacteriota bacterium]